MRLLRFRWWLLSAALLVTGLGAGALWLQAERLSTALQAQGHALVAGGQVNSALTDYTLAILLTPGDHGARLARARAFQALERHREALADLDAAIRLAPDDPDLHLLRGLLLADTFGEHRRAIPDFDAVIRLRPEHALAYYRRGLAYDLANNPHHALLDFSRALVLRPDLAEAYLERAALHGRMGRPEAQAADLTAVLRLWPAATPLYEQRGKIYLGLREFAAAMADFDRALAADPRPDLIFQRGMAHLNLRRYRAAVADFTIASFEFPDSATVYYHRAQAYAALGERGRARADFVRVCELEAAGQSDACFQARADAAAPPRY